MTNEQIAARLGLLAAVVFLVWRWAGRRDERQATALGWFLLGVVQAALPLFPAEGGRIVFVSSVLGLRAVPDQIAYTASKHGVIGLTRAAALEYAKAGIRVNAVCPGAIRTPALDSFFSSSPDIEARVTAQHPIGRLGTAEEVAQAVAQSQGK